MSSLQFSHILHRPTSIPVTTGVASSEATYGTTVGSRALIKAICRYEFQRGSLIDLNQRTVLVTHGATQALSIILAWHRSQGGTAYLPSPGYPTYSLQTQGRHESYVNDDLFGSTSMLNGMRGGDLIVVNSPHNPSGRTIDPELLIHLVKEARGKGIFVCLDAVYDELTPNPQTLSIRYNPNLFWVNSVSKLFNPDLRVGWIVTSSEYFPELIHYAESQSISVSLRNQELAAQLIDDRFSSAEIMRFQDILTTIEQNGALLTRKLPGTRVSSQTGPFSLITLPEEVSVSELNGHLAKMDAHVISGEMFGAPKNTFRIPLAISAELAQQGISSIGSALTELYSAKMHNNLTKYFSTHHYAMISFAETGLATLLERGSAVNLQDVYSTTECDAQLISQLHTLGWIVSIGGDQILLSDFGRKNIPFIYYNWLLEGGYGEVLASNDSDLRNMAVVGLASCQMSKYGAFPLINKFLGLLPFTPTVIDIGCGSGEGTILFAGTNPGITAIGIEPTEELVSIASKTAESKGLSNRVSFISGDAKEALKRCRTIARNGQNLVPVFSFVLHEMVAQRGKSGLVAFLEELRIELPGSPVIVIEPDLIDRSSFSGAEEKFYDFYWEPYYRIHRITNQQLLASKEWNEIFERAGYDIISQEPIQTTVDPCRIEIGYLLSPRQIN